MTLETPLKNRQVLLIVAPNGARASQHDHPGIPITPQELAEEACACADAGAAMIHMHARDQHGKHSLEIQDNINAIRAIRDAVGQRLITQVTTEAVGLYSPEQQIALIQELCPEAASFALKELVPNQESEENAADFFAWVNKNNILAQYILYSNDDIERYFSLRKSGVIPAGQHHLLLVLGRYSKTLQSSPDDLTNMLSPQLLSSETRWAVCAFGSSEYDCLSAAVSLGADVRIGFENNRLTPTGDIAESNSAQVKSIASEIQEQGHFLHTAQSVRELFSI